LRGTTLLAAALNSFAAAGAFSLAARATQPAPPRLGQDETERSRQSASPKLAGNPGERKRAPTPSRSPQPALACAAAAISGFAALVYEVAWTRLLALVIGPTTYAFATMAASFIAGLALGSAVGVRIARRSNAPASWLAAMLLTTAVSASAASWFAASRLPLVVASQ